MYYNLLFSRQYGQGSIMACPEHQGEENISEITYANSTESSTPSFCLVFEKFDYLILIQAKRL